MVTIKLGKTEFSSPGRETIRDFCKRNSIEESPLYRVQEETVDANYVLDADCSVSKVELSEETNPIMYHTSAHVLGAAIMRLYPEAQLAAGPATKTGFHYDCLFPVPIGKEELGRIHGECLRILQGKFDLVKREVGREEMEGLFRGNSYKLEYIQSHDRHFIYKLAEFDDPCPGPHVSNTGFIKHIILNTISTAFFKGDTEKPLTRIAGVSFYSTESFIEYETLQKDLKEKDHRRIGAEYNLFFFSEMSPGSPFFLPAGTIMYNAMVDFIKQEYRKRGYTEVITPVIYNTKLWETSGHLQAYKEHMFCLGDNQAVKPMNCPGHCLIFDSKYRHISELPLRLADFSPLHRNELSGCLTGLTRVRMFHQDDAHIFCTLDQIFAEIKGTLDFLDYVYKVFGFEYVLFISTRPEKSIGSDELWEKAESYLIEACRASGREFTVNEGDGAFYGPKIDVMLTDAYGRKAQCGTVQLDFNLPTAFKLKYTENEAQVTPVMIHRAIFGSIERFLALVLEKFGKMVPFFMSDRQVAIIDICAKTELPADIAELVVDYNGRVIKNSDRIEAKVRHAITTGYHYVVVVGDRDVASGTMAVRGKGNLSVCDLRKEFDRMLKDKLYVW